MFEAEVVVHNKKILFGRFTGQRFQGTRQSDIWTPIPNCISWTAHGTNKSKFVFFACFLSKKTDSLIGSCDGCTRSKFQGIRQSDTWTPIPHCCISSKLPPAQKICKICILCNVLVLEALEGMHLWKEQVNVLLPQHSEGDVQQSHHQYFHFNILLGKRLKSSKLAFRMHKA